LIDVTMMKSPIAIGAHTPRIDRIRSMFIGSSDG